MFWIIPKVPISIISFNLIFFAKLTMCTFQFFHIKYKRILLIILYYKRLGKKRESIFLLINYLCSMYKRNRGGRKSYSKHLVRHSSLILEAPDPLERPHGTLSHPFWTHPAYLFFFFRFSAALYPYTSLQPSFITVYPPQYYNRIMIRTLKNCGIMQFHVLH